MKTSLLQPDQDVLFQPYQDVVAPTNLIKTSLLHPYQDLIAPNLSRLIAPTLSRPHCSKLIKTYCSSLIKTSCSNLIKTYCSSFIKTSLLQPYQDVIASSLIKTSLLQHYQDCDSRRLDEVVSGDEICVCLNESVRKTETKAWEDSAQIATPRYLSPETRRARKKPHWQIAQGHTTTHLLTGRRFHSKSALGTAIYQCLSGIHNIEYRVQNLDCL